MVKLINPDELKWYSPSGYNDVKNKRMVGKDTGTTKMSVVLQTMAPGGVSEMHIHEDADQFHYMIKGEVTITSPESNFVLTEGNCCWTAPGELHGMKNESGKESFYLVLLAPNPGW